MLANVENPSKALEKMKKIILENQSLFLKKKQVQGIWT